jgi:hypothetical protein
MIDRRVHTPRLLRVKLRKTQSEQMSSGLLLKADNARRRRHVANVPQETHAPQQIADLFNHLVGARE